ncbi:DUF116 domain-containing protein [Desulfolucanica intricata]|uniref:DUF116 domain-containing protein n=1 Tax=Desulfolucanica intricata TaxID=1285191 RepID=UPI00082BC683|nr:DUF116 domain-containing protein [Desulfolucanica intricata]
MKGQPENLHARKRLFLGLLLASMVTLCLMTAAIWYLVLTPDKSVLQLLILYGLVAVVAGAVLLALFGICGMLITIYWSKTVRPLQIPIHVAVNLLFPIVLTLGQIFHIDKDRIKSSFIEVNNNLVRAKHLIVNPRRLLLLVPHCLQNSDCPYKITVDINNCRRCGKCAVSDLLKLRDKYGVILGMATGGTLARKFVRQYYPEAIVAVACERDLTSGIQDVNPIPVLGVTNERPNGPCFNTNISITRVEEAIQLFILGES